ncbi:hypothetical protein [Gimesia aquarii]|uniref:Uncharacterized protein n=1 Tax=Gimesia aquarii TaxID=2527964 RepID=A0A517WVJ1_9PLAN|nr:hypothetical protein [Gimesia aquarii]QDU09262.1 hypothetical protein V202x_26350 [Gimesia aquarii]
MSEINNEDQRLIYQTCPCCKADVEREAEECLFCDFDFRRAQFENGLLETKDNSTSYFTMFIVNLLMSMISIFVTSMESPSRKNVAPYKSAISDQDQELFTKFMIKHDQSIPLEIKTLINREEETERLKIVSVTVSGQKRFTTPCTKTSFNKGEFDLLERFRVPQTK